MTPQAANLMAVGEEVECGERSGESPAFVFVLARHGSGWVLGAASFGARGNRYRPDGV